MYQRPSVHIRIFCKRWSLILGCFFPVSILNEDIPIKPVFEAVNTEVDSPGELQEYGALNIKKKIDAEELEKKRLI